MSIRTELRTYTHELLRQHDHHDPVADGQSLILSGLLDSLAIVHLVVFMEEKFGLDFSDLYFDQNVFDTIDDMVDFVEANRD